MTSLGMRRNRGSPHEEGPPLSARNKEMSGGLSSRFSAEKEDQMVLGQGGRLVSGEEKKVLSLPLPPMFKIPVKIF